MLIDFEKLIAYDDAISNPENIFNMVDEKGMIALIKDNQPKYLLIRFSNDAEKTMELAINGAKKRTLHEAMKEILLEKPNKTMHASDLANEIFNKKLYFKKDGTKAGYNQVRARCGQYPDIFEALPGNYIKLLDNK